MGLFSSPTDPTLRLRLARIERKLDALLTHLQIENPDDDEYREVRDLAAAGEKIAAIRRYRELTGVGLAEAKAAVESI